MINNNNNPIFLVNGAYNIIELWEAKTPYQKQWKKQWLENAKKLINAYVNDLTDNIL